MSILNLIYYAAIATCGIEGAQKGVQKQLGLANVLACSYLCALGGGLFRDIFILHIYPTALTNGCLAEIVISLLAGLLYWEFDKYRKYLRIFSDIFDAVGLSQFISIGADKVQNNNIIAVLSAVTTSLLGGIITSVFSGEPIKVIILSNYAYRIITVGGAIVYVILIKCGIEDTNAQGILAFYTTFFILASNSKVREAIIQYFTKLLKNLQQNAHSYIHLPYDLILPVQMFICNDSFFNKVPTYNFTALKKLHVTNRSAVFLLHRIRRM